MKDLSIVALIPARQGSKRVPGKNIREIAGHPLLAYTIVAAINSGIFSDVVVSTDSEQIAAIAEVYGAKVPFLRPAEYAGDLSPDIEWIRYTLQRLGGDGYVFNAFAILRPTSPLRKPETIRRAWNLFRSDCGVDSLRAVELCKQHPAKQWFIDNQRMQPVMVNPDVNATPWHSSPYQTLPKVYAQNASLEIAYADVPFRCGTISGNTILPFLTVGYEGYDINNEEDWLFLELLLKEGKASLPLISK